MLGLGEPKKLYDSRNGVERLSGVGGWVKRWMHGSDCDTLLRCDEATYLQLLFFFCIEQEAEESRLALLLQKSLEIAAAAAVTHSFEYVAFPPPVDSLNLLSNFEYWLKEFQFEQRSRVPHHALLIVKWICVDMFGISTHDREKFFVCLPSWRFDYDGSSLLGASTPTVLAYHSSFALRPERRSFFLSIATAEHLVLLCCHFSRLL